MSVGDVAGNLEAVMAEIGAALRQARRQDRFRDARRRHQDP